MDLSLEIVFEPLEQTNNTSILGTYLNWQYHGFSIGRYNTWRMTIGNSQVQMPTITSIMNTIIYDGSSQVIANGESRAFTPGTIETNVPLVLFAENSNGTITRFIKARIASFKLGSMIDYIAVSKNGIGYMYDRISGQLIGNSGSDEFIVGPRKS